MEDFVDKKIIDVCKGKTYSCVGYKWMFKEDYEKSKCYEQIESWLYVRNI